MLAVISPLLFPHYYDYGYPGGYCPVANWQLQAIPAVLAVHAPTSY